MSFLPKAIIKRYQTILLPETANANDSTEKEVYDFLKNQFEALPKMPGYLFDTNENPPTNPPSNRTQSTDRFFVIRYEFQKLKSYQEMILNIMEQLKYELLVIPIDISKLGIQPNDRETIFKLSDCKKDPKDIYKNKFYAGAYTDFNIFLFAYESLHKSLFVSKGVGTGMSSPLFYNMINSHYKGKAKKFILRILKEYIKVSKILQKMYSEFWGILAYEQVFDISKRPIINILKKNQKKYENDFNTNFNNQKIYNETRQNRSSPSNSSNPNSNEEDMEGMDYLTLDFNTNIYDQVGNEFLYTSDLEKKITDTIQKIQELLKKLYTTKKQNLYDLFQLIFQIDFYTQQFILYYANPNTYRESLKVKDKIYEEISNRIEIYENFIEEFIYWIKTIRGSAGDMGLSIQDPRLLDVFKTFKEFYTSLFDKTKEERKAAIQEKLSQMGITTEVSTTFDEISEEELKELAALLDQLEGILS